MKLTKIEIENYRSIKHVVFDIQEREDNSFSYGLIGINEAGKSSILKAIGLKEGLVDASGTKLPLSRDFREKENIRVCYSYEISEKNDKEIYEIINKQVVPAEVEKTVDGVENPNTEFSESKKDEHLDVPTKQFLDDLVVKFQISYTTASSEPTYLVSLFDEEVEIIVGNNQELKNYMSPNVHKTIFWTAEDRYLISKPINIEQFITDTNTSIPLRNCFILSSIQQNEIEQNLKEALTDTTVCEHLEETLGENVTKHIKLAWPNHPIKITFKIMDGHINFHVRDIDTKERAQTSDMRSDGFKQFVSFLLTIAAQNKNEELERTILLLDEPETHLHPKAQEYLLTQLIEITNNKKNNIVLFATHSNYMIDKKDLGRYYRIEKKKDENGEEHTQIGTFDKKLTSYAEVSYEVFDILDEQYHNQLYDKLRDWFVCDKNSKENDSTKHIESIGINAFDDQYLKQNKKLDKTYQDTSKPKAKGAKVTLPTFIRNCIHYPTNKKEDFDTRLKESIELLRIYVKEDTNLNEK